MLINSTSVRNSPYPYFIADIASNHRGSLTLAKELISACKESMVNAVKFQNFTASTLVSSHSFARLENKASHQQKWKKSVFDSYQEAEVSIDWLIELQEYSHNLGIDFLTSPYSLSILELSTPYIDAVKIGSGDITYHQLIKQASDGQLPILLATGASDLSDVIAAVNLIQDRSRLCIMQCNTEYTANTSESYQSTLHRLSNINLRVLEAYANYFPDICLGLSDHTHGDLTVLMATSAYNAQIIEKHFTLDNTQEGQDHSFSMTPNEWVKMVDNTIQVIDATQSVENKFKSKAVQSLLIDMGYSSNEIIAIQGNGMKKIQPNEIHTYQVQRRSCHLNKDIPAGHVFSIDDFCYLRPKPPGSYDPSESDLLVGRKSKYAIVRNEVVLESAVIFDE